MDGDSVADIYRLQLPGRVGQLFDASAQFGCGSWRILEIRQRDGALLRIPLLRRVPHVRPHHGRGQVLQLGQSCQWRHHRIQVPISSISLDYPICWFSERHEML